MNVERLTEAIVGVRAENAANDMRRVFDVLRSPNALWRLAFILSLLFIPLGS